MAIVCESRLDPFIFHNLKARAIGEAPALVSASLITVESSAELFRRLWKDNDGRIVTDCFDDASSGQPQMRTGITKTVQELSEDHFRGYYPASGDLPRHLGNFFMQRVPRI